MERPAFAFPSLPGGMDRVLKKHFDSFRVQKKLPPELEKEGLNARLFGDSTKLNAWRNAWQGISFREQETGSVFKGALDDVLVVNEKLAVLDFKTRSTPPSPNGHEWYHSAIGFLSFPS